MRLTAGQALIRALFGEFSPKGTLPGTLRKSKKVLKSRQQWLVENYETNRDRSGLDDLIRAVARASAPNLDFLRTTSAASFELGNAHIEESHFVVRNSSTKALYGFCATYYINGVGIVGALLVDPAKRNVSIGRSLHRRAMRNLTQKPGLQKLQLGTSFPAVFLGIPADDESSAALRSWFASSGWDLTATTTQQPNASRRLLTNMVVADVGGWAAPEGLTQSLARAGVTFDLIHGPDNAEGVLAHVRAHADAGAEVLELYQFALRELKTCGVVRAKSSSGGGGADGSSKILGTIIISSPGSALPRRVPCLQTTTTATGAQQLGQQQGQQQRGGELVGGIVAPLVAPCAGGAQQAQHLATLVLQGLAYMSVRQNKAHRASRSVLSWVTDDLCEPLLAMGFQVLQSFEEVTNSPENVSAAHTQNTKHTHTNASQWSELS